MESSRVDYRPCPVRAPNSAYLFTMQVRRQSSIKVVSSLCIGITFESIQFPDTFIDWDTPLAYPIYRLISVAKLGVYRKRFASPCLLVSPHSLSIWRLPLRHIRDITVRTTEKIYDARSKDNLAASIEKSMFDRTC
ncbi:hypothetical protein V1477_017126 [Vespula maculifrons]|uniref:Uncharacterized protein n=1 Tax=Vespula maculifrons TaxID=7453 RepID=A0ABD2B546_VESMC